MNPGESERRECDKDCIPFEKGFLSDRGLPLVFNGAIDKWPSACWTPDHLADVLEERRFQCKICPVAVEDTLWETDSLHLEISLADYCEWLNQSCDVDNPLSQFHPEKYSCYIDYKYMKEMFQDTPDLLKDVCWNTLGLAGRDGGDSTVWIGSAGAYTPCHQDTYGFNLVAQLHGSKRWYLFPPWQTEGMYPTRIPYEESSIYSAVNVRFPDLNKHPKFQNTTPYVVNLTPGQVLYVPRHWWHFVECTESAISVNTWVPMMNDVSSHLHEAVCRLLVTALSPLATDGGLINTNEELQASSVNLEYIRAALGEYMQTGASTGSNQCCNNGHTAGGTCGHGHGLGRTMTETKHDTNLLMVAERFAGHVLHCTDCGHFQRLLTPGVKRKARNDNGQGYHSQSPKNMKSDSLDRLPSVGTGTCNEAVGRFVSSVDNAHDKDVALENENQNVLDLNNRNDSNDFVGNTRTDPDTGHSQSVLIFQLQSVKFSAFKTFLENEFFYESACTTAEEKCTGNVTSRSDWESSGIGSAVVSVDEIINSVLDQSVIRHICDVLVKKKKT